MVVPEIQAFFLENIVSKFYDSEKNRKAVTAFLLSVFDFFFVKHATLPASPWE